MIQNTFFTLKTSHFSFCSQSPAPILGPWQTLVCFLSLVLLFENFI
uniref:Alternative protein METTL4 n=1 Tax=Homo sapiens TaxID=9606 RepID=L8EB52_HUMAN|nr:alternative protein METTL4 [Homo sapiens]